MKLKNILKDAIKVSKVTQTSLDTPKTDNISILFEVSSWHIHEEETIAFLLEMYSKDAFNHEYKTTRVPCKLVPEDNNSHDANATLVTVACPKSRKYYTVGYVPTEYSAAARSALDLVASGAYYWHCKVAFSAIYGTKFKVELRKSKYQ